HGGAVPEHPTASDPGEHGLGRSNRRSRGGGTRSVAAPTIQLCVHSERARRTTVVETAFDFVDFSAYRERLGADGDRIVGDIRWFEHADFALLVTFAVDMFTNRINLTLN